MQDTLFRKSLVTAIIILFVGTSIIPSLGGITIKKEFKNLIKILNLILSPGIM